VNTPKSKESKRALVYTKLRNPKNPKTPKAEKPKKHQKPNSQEIHKPHKPRSQNPPKPKNRNNYKKHQETTKLLFLRSSQKQHPRGHLQSSMAVMSGWRHGQS